MADPSKKRLGKVAQEFNVSTEKIVDLLNKKDYSIENNPNAKLDENMYEILVKEYSGERKVKENAQKKNIETPKSGEPAPVVKPVVVEREEVEEKQVFIKDNTILKVEAKLEGVKVLGTLDLDKPKSKPEQPKEKPVKEVEKVSEKPKVKEPAKKELPEEVKSSEVLTTPISPKSAIKSVGFIDLNTLNTKTKPAKKTDDQLRSEIENRKAVTDKLQEKKQKSEAVAETPIIVPAPEPTTPADNSSVQLSEDVYKTEFKKLEGPKIMGKIDLDSFKKPVAKSDGNSVRSEDRNKKRRKRLLPPGQQQQGGTEGGQNSNNRSNNPQGGNTGGGQQQNNRNNQSPQQGQNNGTNNAQPRRTSGDNNAQPRTGGNAQPRTGGNAQQPRTGTNTGGTSQPRTGGNAQPRTGGAPGQGGQQGQNRPNPNYRGNNTNPRFNKNAPVKEVKKVELTDEEIDRQIKETLARLSPTGKSKTSKHRRDKRNLVSQKATDLSNQELSELKVIKVAEFLTANELAFLMDVPVTQIISICMSIGLFVSINQRLDAETITLLADEFGFTVVFIGADAEEEVEEIDNPEDLAERSAIVTVMGHVDHGKTSLLDYIRNANVIGGEAGGITQHIGAYEVKLKNGKRITFLDTPGHEAFTAMRARGAKVTDIAIIVIAADDTIMPQTIEAINHAQAAGVPMIFAINKVDKPGANPDKIREGLSAMNILVEEWGGKFQSQEISAKKGLNIDHLLDKVLIEAEFLELKANASRLAIGTVIESSLDKGKGYVAKILVQNGTLKIGDVVVAGSTVGRVKAMFNERNAAIQEAGPSVPLLLLGLNAAPQAGDTFKVYKDEHEAKGVANKRAQLLREQGIRTQKHITLDEIGRRIAIGDFKELNIIVKGDVDGSVEALSDSLLKLSSSQVQVNVIHKSVGSVTESDVLLASASNAIIIAFQVRPSLQARKLAEMEEIDIRTYSIIYNAINEIKDAIEGMLSPEIQEKIVCNIEVREVFNITKVGAIAGSIVLDGKINRQTKIRVIRNGIVVYSGKLSSLKRFKDEVKEVFAGQDCGLGIDNYNDIKVADIIEGYDEIEVKRTIK